MQFSIERICYDFGKEQRIWFQDGLIEPLPEYSGGVQGRSKFPCINDEGQVCVCLLR